MGKITDAINQAIGQAVGMTGHSPDAQRGGGEDYDEKDRSWVHRWSKPRSPRGDRNAEIGRVEKPMDFYKRQAAALKRMEDNARAAEEARIRQRNDRQGPHGNPTQGKWGGVW